MTPFPAQQADLDRCKKRLKDLENVRPAFMDEFEKLEKVPLRTVCECRSMTSYMQYVVRTSLMYIPQDVVGLAFHELTIFGGTAKT